MKVRVGQLWADNDPRAAGRTIRITEVGKYIATAEVITSADYADDKSVGRSTRISLSRFKPTSTGYRLLNEGD